ncbi:hypothetical protein ACLOJK_016280 [Asimina triloba]
MGYCDVSLLKPTFHRHLFPCHFFLPNLLMFLLDKQAPSIYVYLKELISNFTLVILVYSMLSEPALIVFYVAIIVMVGYYTVCYWGEHGANVMAAAISKEIEKAERRFDLKMTPSLLAVQASMARMEGLFAHDTMLQMCVVLRPVILPSLLSISHC